MAVLIPFALNVAENRYVDATNVPSGRACGCVCPGCGRPMIARLPRRSRRTPHFAHEPGCECANAWESALHKTAKQIVGEAFALNLPLFDTGLRWEWKMSASFLEKPHSGFIPDVTTQDEDGAVMLVEIRVTHAVDEAKEAKIRSAKVTCVEIDLSRVRRHILYAELEKKLLAGGYPVRYVHNEFPGLEQYRHAGPLGQRRKRQSEDSVRAEATKNQNQEEWRLRAPWLRP